MPDPVKYPYYARWAEAVASGELAVFGSILLGLAAFLLLIFVRRVRPRSFPVIRFGLIGGLYIGMIAILIWQWTAR